MYILRQNTAVDVLIGQFIDITDGSSAEVGESPSVKLSKNGQTLAAKNDATTPAHDADGNYNCELDATDTNTVGTLDLRVAASANARPVRHEYQVLESNAYDALYATSATILTSLDIGQLQENVIATATSDSDFLMTDAFQHNSLWVGQIVMIEDATSGAPWVTWVKTMVSATKQVTVEPDPTGTGLTIPFAVAAGDICRFESRMHPMYALNTKNVATTSNTDAVIADALINTQVLARSDAANATDNAAKINSVNTNNGSGPGDYDSEIDSLEAILDSRAADVLTQINAAFDTVIAELGVGAPTATPTVRTALMLLYMAVVNKRDTTAALDEIHNAAGTVITDAVVSDAAGVFSKAKYIAP